MLGMKRILLPTIIVVCTVIGTVLWFNQAGPLPKARTHRVHSGNGVQNATLQLAQAEQVKGKAKDLKKKIEGQQTNQVEKTPPPPVPKK